MIKIDFKNKQTILIIIAIALLSIFALWIRLLPMFMMGKIDILTIVASDDPLYNLRQVEQILANFPNYAWYDPFSLYPVGSNIYWGPLFPLIIAVACLIMGATTRPEIIAVGLLIPPIMGMCMVPVMYYIGKFCGDWKTGLFSAFFIAVVSGQYFFRSFYGYMDHHMAEVLFSTIFCLCYIYTLYSVKNTKIVLTDFATYKKLCILSVLTGIAYLVGLFVMPTMILFAMIVGIFTVLQSIIDGLREKPSEYLLAINIITFFTITVGLLAFGMKTTNIDLATYSIGHVFAYLGLIGGTAILYIIPKYLVKGNYLKALGAIIGGTIAFIVVLAIFLPQFYNVFIVSLFSFFGQQAITNTVQEAMPWSTLQAWSAFNYGLILMFGGILVMLYTNIKDEHPYYIFSVIWSIVVFFSTWQHVRYEYYLAVPLALLSAVCVGYLVNLGYPGMKKFADKLSGTDKKEQSGIDDAADHDKSKSKPKDKRLRKHTRQASVPAPTSQILPLLVIVIIGVGGMFAFTSASQNYVNAANGMGRMNMDWKESLEWMYNNTPDSGVNYTEIYTPTTFQYPKTAYGVMSWWDYGHMITYIAKRIPNANPFQQGVVGMNGSANFFMAATEAEGNKVLDSAGTRYIITDIEMDTGKFWAMATWFNATLAGSPYQLAMLTPNQNIMTDGEYSVAQVNTQEYFTTMVSRLHNFDGSLVVPQTTYYIEYVDPTISQMSLPVITAASQVNVSESVQKVSEYNSRAVEGHHATLISPVIIAPIAKIPALQHYRLVHESPSNVFSTNEVDLKYVKVFEYVKGAHISGEGVIELPLISNTGRIFTYRQESVNGSFIVPYSTDTNPGGVQALGKYRIIGSDVDYDVPELAIIQGGSWRKI